VLWNDLDRSSALTPFVATTSDWEDNPDHRQACERDGLITSQRFLRGE